VMYKKLLNQLQEQASGQGIDIEKGTTASEISTRVDIHTEANLLAYHLQNPHIHPYRYFGGSKLSCRSCASLFSGFNHVAESFQCSQFFTKPECCHNHAKIYLRWPCPSLFLSTRMERPTYQSLGTQVRKEMTEILSTELAGYVQELRRAVTPVLSPSAASSELDEFMRDIIARIKAEGELAGMCVWKLRCLCILIIAK